MFQLLEIVVVYSEPVIDLNKPVTDLNDPALELPNIFGQEVTEEVIAKISENFNKRKRC